MKNKEKNFISAVVYVQNYEETICDFVLKIGETLRDNFENYEIICVDDGSRDNSVAKIKETALNSSLDMLTIVELSYSQGLEVAMTAGVDLAIGDFVFEFDKNYINYNTDLIMDVYYKSLEGYDVVSAVDKSFQKSSTLFYNIFNRSSKIKAKLKTETFRVLSRRLINRIRSMCHITAYRKALYANSGLKVTSIFYKPIKIIPKKDKGLSYKVTTATDSLLLFTNFGYKIALTLSGIMMMLGIIQIIYAIIDYFNGIPIEGFTTIILVVTISFFVVFALFAIVIKYLSLIMHINFNQNNYVIKNVEKINANKGGLHE